MDLFVIKRDGCRVPFNIKCIQDAIFAAAKSVQQESIEYAAEVANKVHQILIVKDVSSEHSIEIHTIQNTVEDVLMRAKDKSTARAYIEYRHDRDIKREKVSALNAEIGRASCRERVCLYV